MSRMTISPFAYVNSYYGLNLRKHSPVVQTSTGKRGQVVSSTGAHIMIQWDGEPKVKGPYHPTDNLQYPTTT